MKTRISLLASLVITGATLLAQQPAPPAAPPAGAQPPAGRGGCQGRGQGGIQQSPFTTPPVRIYLYAGLKTHGEGQHDYPQFLADWSKLLTEHGAVVDGALHSPRAADLERADVVVVYKGDAAYLSDGDKTALEAYVKRG